MLLLIFAYHRPARSKQYLFSLLLYFVPESRYNSLTILACVGWLWRLLYRRARTGGCQWQETSLPNNSPSRIGSMASPLFPRENSHCKMFRATSSITPSFRILWTSTAIFRKAATRAI